MLQKLNASNATLELDPDGRPSEMILFEKLYHAVESMHAFEQDSEVLDSEAVIDQGLKDFEEALRTYGENGTDLDKDGLRRTQEALDGVNVLRNFLSSHSPFVLNLDQWRRECMKEHFMRESLEEGNEADALLMSSLFDTDSLLGEITGLLDEPSSDLSSVWAPLIRLCLLDRKTEMEWSMERILEKLEGTSGAAEGDIKASLSAFLKASRSLKGASRGGILRRGVEEKGSLEISAAEWSAAFLSGFEHLFELSEGKGALFLEAQLADLLEKKEVEAGMMSLWLLQTLATLEGQGCKRESFVSLLLKSTSPKGSLSTCSAEGVAAKAAREGGPWPLHFSLQVLWLYPWLLPGPDMLTVARKVFYRDQSLVKEHAPEEGEDREEGEEEMDEHFLEVATSGCFPLVDSLLICLLSGEAASVVTRLSFIEPCSDEEEGEGLFMKFAPWMQVHLVELCLLAGMPSPRDSMLPELYKTYSEWILDNDFMEHVKKVDRFRWALFYLNLGAQVEEEADLMGMANDAPQVCASSLSKLLHSVSMDAEEGYSEDDGREALGLCEFYRNMDAAMSLCFRMGRLRMEEAAKLEVSPLKGHEGLPKKLKILGVRWLARGEVYSGISEAGLSCMAGVELGEVPHLAPENSRFFDEISKQQGGWKRVLEFMCLSLRQEACEGGEIPLECSYLLHHPALRGLGVFADILDRSSESLVEKDFENLVIALASSPEGKPYGIDVILEGVVSLDAKQMVPSLPSSLLIGFLDLAREASTEKEGGRRWSSHLVSSKQRRSFESQLCSASMARFFRWMEKVLPRAVGEELVSPRNDKGRREAS